MKERIDLCNEFIGVRVTTEQREKLDKMAKESGLRISDVIRLCIDSAQWVSLSSISTTLIE